MVDKKREFSIPIAFCSDEVYFKHALVTIISLIESNPNTIFQFHLISEEKKGAIVDVMEKYVKKLGSSFEFHELASFEFEGLPVTMHFSKAMYLRLKIPSLIRANKVLYLDPDVICNGSIQDLEKIEMGVFALAAVGDPVGNWNKELGMKAESVYLNSGILLFQTKIWNEENLSDRILKYMVQNSKSLRFPDQCGINSVIDGNFLKLPLKFNLQGSFFRKDFMQKRELWRFSEIKEAMDSPVLIHFTGPSKPWQYNCPHPLKSLYWKYQKKSPFKLKFPIGMKCIDHVKALFPKSLKQKIKNLFLG